MNVKGIGGRPPLRFAAEQGHNEIAELLIAGSAEVNAKDNYGKTPLDHADSKWKPIRWKKPYEDHVETAALPRKHGGKTGDELKAEGK